MGVWVAAAHLLLPLLLLLLLLMQLLLPLLLDLIVNLIVDTLKFSSHLLYIWQRNTHWRYACLTGKQDKAALRTVCCFVAVELGHMGTLHLEFTSQEKILRCS